MLRQIVGDRQPAGLGGDVEMEHGLGLDRLGQQAGADPHHAGNGRRAADDRGAAVAAEPPLLAGRALVGFWPAGDEAEVFGSDWQVGGEGRAAGAPALAAVAELDPGELAGDLEPDLSAKARTVMHAILRLLLLLLLR